MVLVIAVALAASKADALSGPLESLYVHFETEIYLECAECWGLQCEEQIGSFPSAE